MSHPASVYRSLEQLLTECVVDSNEAWKIRSIRYWTRVWNTWRSRHPGEPYIIKCAICSGKARKIDRKHGQWKDSKPRRTQDD